MTGSDANYYESDRALAEYLLFHYGQPDQVNPPSFVPSSALSFPARCVSECVESGRLPKGATALDLGCAVGRGTFELARHCDSVLGIDRSERFITIAGHLKKNGSFLFGYVEEGDLTHPSQAVVPAEIDRQRVRFERGDVLNLPDGLGAFDVVLMANLIDRLSDPRRGLERLPNLVKGGGQLIVVSPYSWMTEYTPREKWLGGFEKGGKRHRSMDALKEILSPAFEFQKAMDLPFLLREHARKFQLGVAQASMWTRRK